MKKQLLIDLKKITSHLDGYTMSSGYDTDTLEALSFVSACMTDIINGIEVGAEDFVTDSVKDTINLFFSR